MRMTSLKQQASETAVALVESGMVVSDWKIALPWPDG